MGRRPVRRPVRRLSRRPVRRPSRRPRTVAEDSSVPSRIRLVSRARAPSVTQAPVGPGSPARAMAITAHGEVVVGAR